ncbi:MAG: thymidine phosphorylase [Capsulimonadales bacterium]|nr:thymidine phosphorylase [Capsulimonadales bacterium]
MTMQEIIAVKRDGGALTDAQVNAFVRGYVAGEIPDYQASALLMAIYLRGMDVRETATLTAAMAESGERIDLSGLPVGRPTLDKHSTGGVGDKTTLVVVPILAAAGVAVCKMSGRGLGHTGGTLDKLESIPAFRVGLSPTEMTEQVRRVGACLAGQTDRIAPADKKLYALRDATATVGSLPLIVSSILSKKLAGGAQNLLFDVKVGNGALLRTPTEARELAKALVDGAKANGRRAVAVLSDMNQPLGRTIGNAAEVEEAIATLSPDAPEGDPRFRELCLFLANEGLKLAGRPADAERYLASGAALSTFREIVRAQGGDITILENADRWRDGVLVREASFADNGYVAAIDTAELGHIVVGLGGGRRKKEDVIDPAVGLVFDTGIGRRAVAGETFCRVLARTEAAAQSAIERLHATVVLSPEPVAAPPLVPEVLRSHP